VYSKLGHRRRLSGIAPFQDFMAHGRLQAAITTVDIVLPLSIFLFFYLFVTDMKSEIYHCEITNLYRDVNVSDNVARRKKDTTK